MVSPSHVVFNASDRSYMALLKKDIHRLCVENDFGEKSIAEIDIIVAEMTSNLIKHGGGGEILAGISEDTRGEALELICIDGGPGMQDSQKMLRDGVSSSLTLGHGLGAMQRLSDVFQIYSLKDWGTVLLARIYKREGEGPVILKPGQLETRAIVLCKPGERVSGDGYCVRVDGENTYLFMGDGLGHGPEAHRAVMESINVFQTLSFSDPVDAIRSINVQIRKTRGLVISVGVFSALQKRWTLCGVGNISTRMYSSTEHKNYMPYNGIVGLNLPTTMHAVQVEAEKNQILTMCSDGIRTRWDMIKYPGITKYDPSILAAALYKDHGRGTDDMSVLVSRVNK